jgi:hypothetical protein
VVRASSLVTIARLRRVPAEPLTPVRGGWDGPAATGTVYLSTEHDPGWVLEGSDRDPFVAFGWATAFEGIGGPVRVRHEGSLAAGLRVALLVILWGAALWATRRPVGR